MYLQTNPQDIACFYIPDVIYSERDNLELHLQIILPKTFPENKEKKYPLIVFVQGSAWFKQNCYMNVPNLSRFAHRGYAIAIVEYRYSEIAPFPAQIEDAKTAIRFMRKNADEYAVDTDKIYLWGDSSGGHTALLAGLTCNDNILDTDLYSEYSSSVNAIVNFYGVTDISKQDFPASPDHLLSTSPVGMLMGGIDLLDKMDSLKPAIAMTYISKNKEIPPIITFHGTKDSLVAYHQGELLAACLEENNKIYEFHTIVDADHGGTAFWKEEVLDLVENFITKY